MSEEKSSERGVGGLKIMGGWSMMGGLMGGRSMLLAFAMLGARVVASENLTGGNKTAPRTCCLRRLRLSEIEPPEQYSWIFDILTYICVSDCFVFLLWLFSIL